MRCDVACVCLLMWLSPCKPRVFINTLVQTYESSLSERFVFQISFGWHEDERATEGSVEACFQRFVCPDAKAVDPQLIYFGHAFGIDEENCRKSCFEIAYADVWAPLLLPGLRKHVEKHMRRVGASVCRVTAIGLGYKSVIFNKSQKPLRFRLC